MRVSLDTSVVNFIIENSEAIFDGCDEDPLNARVSEDVQSLNQIFSIGRHSYIEFLVTRTVVDEIHKTGDGHKFYQMFSYVSEVHQYFQGLGGTTKGPSNIEMKYLDEYLIKGDLKYFRGYQDRRIIIEALSNQCTHLCTRDWKTILKFRDTLISARIKMVTPTEWLSDLINHDYC